jgi:hypothetical protein
MNTPTPPPIPPSSVLALGERLLPTCGATGIVVLLGDFLFWNHRPGLSLAIFAVAMAALLVVQNWRVARGPRVCIALLLLVVSAGQTAVEISFTNVVVVAALFAVLLAELRYLQLPSGWARWSESLVAWGSALGRWAWLVQALNEQPLAGARGLRLGERVLRLLRIGLPAVALLIVFIIVFSAGNRIFHQFFNRTVNHFYAWIGDFDFQPARILFWFCLATVGLAFVRPREGAKTPRSWAQPLAEWTRDDGGVAFWQSALILAALNALFFAVNTIDVIYLWQRAAPPEGVLARDYLYQGVYSLITATVLAGVVLTFLFQQSANVTAARALRVLAYAWIAQNFVLIAGVFLRLKLFLDLSDVTEKRVYVACFLLLVVIGFGLLCAHVARGRLAGPLIWRNTVATFALFFVLQFLNVAAWVARENFARLVRSPQNFGINVPYNMNLGPGSWAALIEIAGRLPAGEVRDELILDLRERARLERSRLAALDWRERQFRHDRNAASLAAWAAPFGELTDEEQRSPAIERMHSAYRALRARE